MTGLVGPMGARMYLICVIFTCLRRTSAGGVTGPAAAYTSQEQRADGKSFSAAANYKIGAVQIAEELQSNNVRAFSGNIRHQR